MMKVYMDNAATTALSSEVLNAMMPYLTDIYGNASSVHSFGQDAKKGVDKAREQVARAIMPLLMKLSLPAAERRRIILP